MTRHPSVEQVERALAASDYPDAPTPRAADRRRALAVLDLFEPETVTTVAEVEALPVGSVFLSRTDCVWRVMAEEESEGGFRFESIENHGRFMPATFDRFGELPATVLHRGGDR